MHNLHLEDRINIGCTVRNLPVHGSNFVGARPAAGISIGHLTSTMHTVSGKASFMTPISSHPSNRDLAQSSFGSKRDEGHSG